MQDALDRVDSLRVGQGQLEAGLFSGGGSSNWWAGGFADYAHRVGRDLSLFGRGQLGYDSLAGARWDALAGVRWRF